MALTVVCSLVAAVLGAHGLSVPSLDAFSELYSASAAYEVVYARPSNTAELLDERENELLELAPDATPYTDPVTGIEMRVLLRGRLVGDGGGRVRREEWWTYTKGPIDARTMVTLWSHDQTSYAGTVGAKQARMTPITPASIERRLDARAKGRVSFEERHAKESGFVEFARYVGETLKLATDVQARPGPAGTDIVNSEQWGLRGRLSADGHPERLEMVYGGGDAFIMEVRRWNPRRVFPGRHPAELVLWTRRAGDDDPPEADKAIYLFEPVRVLDHVESEQFSWQSVAKTALNTSTNEIIDHDGNVIGSGSVTTAKIPQAIELVEPQDSPDEPLRPKKPANLARRGIIIAGVVFVVLGGLLWIRRRTA